MDENKNIRIVDIAKMAGVSIGTVDRVIHNRGRVSEENMKKVKAILDMVNYKPNLIARSLVTKKSCKLVTLIPSFRENEYWMYVSDGIDKAAEEAKTHGVIIEKHFFNQYDKKAFEKAIKKILATEFDGIVIANFFRESVIYLSGKLDEAGIPYVYIDTNIEGQNQLAYFGTNSFDSGALAAHLMLERTGKNKDILITKVFYKQQEFSNQVINREKGFMDFIRKTDYAGEIVEAHLRVDAPLQNFDTLDKIFLRNKHLPIAGAITFNSSCHIFGSYLKVRDTGKIYVVGYDLIEKNRVLLKEGIINLLICQRPELQGFNAIKALTNKILLGIDPEKINFMPIDLLIKENVDYYKDL